MSPKIGDIYDASLIFGIMYTCAGVLRVHSICITAQIYIFLNLAAGAWKCAFGMDIRKQSF